MGPEFEKFLKKRSAHELCVQDGSYALHFVKAQFDKDDDVIYMGWSACENPLQIARDLVCIGVYSHVRHQMIAQNSDGIKYFDAMSRREFGEHIESVLYDKLNQEIQNTVPKKTLNDIDSDSIWKASDEALRCYFLRCEPQWKPRFRLDMETTLNTEQYMRAFNHEDEFVNDYMREFLEKRKEDFDKACVLIPFIHTRIETYEREPGTHTAQRMVYESVGEDLKLVTVSITKQDKHFEGKINADAFRRIPNSWQSTFFYTIYEMDKKTQELFHQIFGQRDCGFTVEEIDYIKDKKQYIYQKEA